MPSIWRPKIINLEKCTLVGGPDDAWRNWLVCDGRREALLVSEPHYRLRNGAWSGGGPFYCVKSTLTHTGKLEAEFWRNNSGGKYTILGVFPGPQRPRDPADIPSFSYWQPGLVTDYATGYKRARPGNPVASVGQFLIELRDLPAVPLKGLLKGGAFIRNNKVAFRDVPRVLHKNLGGFRALGSEYLNVVFGWKPFVNDLQKMYNLWKDIDKRMAQIVRENGKGIHRRSTVSNEVTVNQEPPVTLAQAYLGVNGAPPNWFWDGKSYYTVTSTTKTRVWFKGSFRYFIPDTGSSLWNARARLALFGALPTPELLWEVLPWSWLIDWFSNVGDVISNASPNAVDNLTTNYSFIMKRVEVSTEWRCVTQHGAWKTEGWFRNEWPQVDNTFATTEKTVFKIRQGGGNPFGLGIKLADLSGGQLAILAALGISRSKVL